MGIQQQTRGRDAAPFASWQLGSCLPTDLAVRQDLCVRPGASCFAEFIRPKGSLGLQLDVQEQAVPRKSPPAVLSQPLGLQGSLVAAEETMSIEIPTVQTINAMLMA